MVNLHSESYKVQQILNSLQLLTGGDQHAPALKETASHGIMIIAMGNSRSAGRGRLTRRQGGMGADIKAHEEAIAWALKNAGQGKYAKVDVSRMAVAGQSCGGLEA